MSDPGQVIFAVGASGGLAAFGYWLRLRAYSAARVVCLGSEPPGWLPPIIEAAGKLYMLGGLVVFVYVLFTWVTGKSGI